MPFQMMRDTNACPMSKPIAVKKKDTGKVMGCHENEDAAKKQMAALMAAEPNMMQQAVKAEAQKRGMA